MSPPELAQLHASEKRRLLEGNRVINAEKEAAQGEDVQRRENVREANRQQVRENRDALREKWGASSTA